MDAEMLGLIKQLVSESRDDRCARRTVFAGPLGRAPSEIVAASGLGRSSAAQQSEDGGWSAPRHWTRRWQEKGS